MYSFFFHRAVNNKSQEVPSAVHIFSLPTGNLLVGFILCAHEANQMSVAAKSHGRQFLATSLNDGAYLQ